jgi:RNA polymerase-binding transcription factor DksA
VEATAVTRQQLTGYRTKLLTLAADVERSLTHDRRELRREEEPDVAGGPMPSTEDVVDSGAQEVEVGLIRNEEQLLTEVTAALDRIDAGTFGQCAECGRPISQPRLDALPYARQCIRCARAAQPAAR